MPNDRGEISVAEILRGVKDGTWKIEVARAQVTGSGNRDAITQFELGIAALQQEKNLGKSGAVKSPGPRPRTWFPPKRR